MKVTPQMVRGLAELAYLRLDDDEVERMQRDLAAILGYVEMLSELDTADVPPTSHALDLPTPMREDEPRDVLSVEAAVENVPEHNAASMIVPKMIE